MAAGQIQILTEQQAVERISETLKRAPAGDAPFALVLGAGFSQGLVATAQELVVGALPVWVKSVEDGEPFDAVKARVTGDEGVAVAAAFWKKFADRNSSEGLLVKVDATGIPEDIPAAYKAAFNPHYEGAVGTPHDARTFQRDLMRLDQPRLNAPHFLLASILGVQPGKTRKSDTFSTRAALTRLILTTNFDPFLQIALQSVNRLYFMSDTPDLGLGDEIFDDATDAIHLVYLHGSIHRRSQKATDEEIRTIKERNARILAPVLKRHGIIVLGYSGWDDAIVEALAACEAFDHRLYWCGRQPDPTASGAFGVRVPEVLSRPSACYVHIESAGQFMARLTGSLVKGLPRLLDNPVAQLREMLEIIDLTELGAVTPSGPVRSEKTSGLAGITTDKSTIWQAHGRTIQRLKEVEVLFKGLAAPVLETTEAVTLPLRGDPVAGAADTPPVVSAIDRALSSIDLAIVLGNQSELLRLCDMALALPGLDVSQSSRLLFTRGWARSELRDIEGALQDWNAVALLAGAPVEDVAKALYNRGVTWGERGEWGKAIADYTQVIDGLAGVPVEHVASSLYNRALAWGEQGEPDKEIADYRRLIDELPGTPVEDVAKALYNRGVEWGKKGDRDKEIADYARLIDGLPGAPVEQVAAALYNRAVEFGKKGDRDKEIADYTRLIDGLPGAPVEDVAKSLNNRGVAWGQKGDPDKEIADYTRVIDGLPGAPVEQVAKSLNDRGVAWVAKGDPDTAIADYTRVIDGLPGAPVEQVAKALNNRALTWGAKGDPDTAIADYTRVIDELPGAPVEQVAKALNNRALTWGEQGDRGKEIADYTRVIDGLPGAPVEQVAKALNNRGLMWGEQGDHDKQMADYTRVIDGLLGAPVEQVATAFANRGWQSYQSADYARFLGDTMAALEKEPAQDVASFNLGLALLANGRDGDAMEAYRRASQAHPTKVQSLGLEDVEAAMGTWLSAERAQPIIDLLRAVAQPALAEGDALV